MYIAIEGNIGVGKTTLARVLAQRMNATTVMEEYADNNFLPKFYEDADRYAFPLELSFLADRYKQAKTLQNAPQLFNEHYVSDYLFIKSKLFAKLNLKEDEYRLFENIFEIMNEHTLRPDLLIYLQCPMEQLQANIIRRGRPYEMNIRPEYLAALNEMYGQYIRQTDLKTLSLDVTGMDFEHDEGHMERVMKRIEEDVTRLGIGIVEGTKRSNTF